MKKVFIVLLLGSYGLFAEPLSGKFQVGNVENLFDEFVKGGALGSVDFVSSSSEIIPLEPADYYYEDGRFSMTGIRKCTRPPVCAIRASRIWSITIREARPVAV